jgi:hypothetical protein
MLGRSFNGAAVVAVDRGRAPRKRTFWLSLAVAIFLAASAGIARAQPPQLISYGNFSAQTPDPVGVAVDGSNGDVYVAGLLSFSSHNPGHVDKFGPSIPATPIPPSPFGEAYDAGTAVNPTNGDVYVLAEAGLFVGEPLIYTYDPNTGALVGEPFAVPPSNFFGVQIATDSNGNVYVPVEPSDEVLEYDPTGTLLKTFTGGPGAGALRSPSGVAVDSAGDVWVADAGNNRIEELSAAGTPMGTAIASEGVGSVALDGRGDVFAVVNNSVDSCGSVAPPCPHLVEYDSAGAQVADVGAGAFGSAPQSLPSVAVDQPSGRVYVPDGFKEVVWIFGPPAAPTVGRELTAEVTASEAKLGALVGPGGLPTSYRFEYDTSEYREGEGSHGVSVPFPEGSVGEGISARTVWAAVSGLAPGVSYHYRVVATNELGSVVGPDRSFTTLTAGQASCPNEELRGGFSAGLLDCRAYELVTPPTKVSSQPEAPGPAAVDGNAIAFGTREPLPDAATGGDRYVATRGGDGWRSEDLIPLESYTGILCSSEDNSVPAASSELSKVVVSIGKDTRGSKGGTAAFESCNAEGLEVVQGEPVGYENLLLRESPTGTYRLINLPPPGVTPADAHFKGASADLSHVVFGEMAPLTPNAPYSVEDLYEWDEGALRLLTVLPDGTPVAGSLAEGHEGEDGRQAVSADGSHALFVSGGDLYVRIDGERTVQVDQAQGGSGPSGGGVFQAASADGTRVFFTDQSQLTDGSMAASGAPDLYECVLPEGASRCELTDLTVAKAGERADVLQVAALGSKDSSHLYFTARGVLAVNAREYTGPEGEAIVEKATSGEENLYLYDGGAVTFVATLGQGDDLGPVSPDGTWLAFVSGRSLTGYDNGAVKEIFLYGATSGALVCASCNPSGEAPVDGAQFSKELTSRPLSDGGRLFFETTDALLPSDSNGQVDVYEYEDGRLSAISGGTSSTASRFSGASESGDDAFFESTQQLLPEDSEEEAHVIYDARVQGGFPAPLLSPACVTVEACRTPTAPQPSIYGAPSSQTFSGAGNAAPPVEAKKKKSGSKKKPRPRRRARACKRHRRKGPVHCVAKGRRAGSHARAHGKVR